MKESVLGFMKKRIFLVTSVGLLSILSVYAFDWGGWHTFRDYKNGYQGYTKSFYLGKVNSIGNDFSTALRQYIQNEGDYNIESVHSKLTKEEKFLILCELDYWDIENGDVYVVRVQTGPGVQVIMVSVDKKGNVTNWYGYDCEATLIK